MLLIQALFRLFLYWGYYLGQNRPRRFEKRETRQQRSNFEVFGSNPLIETGTCCCNRSLFAKKDDDGFLDSSVVCVLHTGTAQNESFNLYALANRQFGELFKFRHNALVLML